MEIVRALNEADVCVTESISNVVGTNQEFLNQMYGLVERYLDNNGRRWVELYDLFSFMKVTKR